jgi:hypothetical protein
MLLINLTPLIPLSFSRRGGRKIKEGEALLNSQDNTDIYSYHRGRDSREGLRPSLTYTPPFP